MPAARRPGGGRTPAARRHGIVLAAAGLLGAVAVQAPARVHAAQPATIAPPPYAAQPVPGADGPGVVDTDPFSLDAPGLAPGQIELTTVSTRPSLVSGDRVRVEVRGLGAGDTVGVSRDGRDSGAVLLPVAGHPGSVDGVVTGLHVGANTLVAIVTGAAGRRSATLVVTGHPLDGPVLSGAHQEPFICETADSGMGPATTPDCDAPTQFHWYARSAVTQQFSRLSDPYAAYPPDTSTTTTADGRSVPFVVRIESEVVNRSITRIAVLDDPHARGAGPAFTPSEWNRRLLYVFGEYCGTGHHQGVFHETDVLGDPQAANEEYAMPVFADLPGHIGSGYMVVISSLTTLAVHCNPLLSAETAMMVKEHIVDDYGVVAHTIGVGGSGGAIQPQMIANMYPGIIDADTPMLSFPDVYNPFATVLDCHAMETVFNADPTRWTPDKQTAVTGLANPNVCRDWDTTFTPMFDPTNCVAGVPAAERYDPAHNPRGVRCDMQEGEKVVWGADPVTGFGNRPLDNVGLQYGLAALQQGAISVDDFIALNKNAGGLDIDGHTTATRTAMSADDAAIAFATGWQNGRGAINEIPLIDVSVPFIDDTPMYDVHDQMRPFEMRARLDANFGSHANQAIWSGGPLPSTAIDAAEEWLNSLDDYDVAHPGLDRATAVARSRPASAADQCRALVTGTAGPCDQGVDRHTSTRQAAGEPMTEDVIKCHLRPLAAREYPASTTADQLAQIRAAFPDGVCDFSRQSIGTTPRSTTWLSWGGGTAGTEPVVIPYPTARSAGRSAQLNGVEAASGGVIALPDTRGAGPAGGAAVAASLMLAGAAARRRRRGR